MWKHVSWGHVGTEVVPYSESVDESAPENWSRIPEDPSAQLSGNTNYHMEIVGRFFFVFFSLWWLRPPLYGALLSMKDLGDKPCELWDDGRSGHAWGLQDLVTPISTLKGSFGA